MRRKDREMDWEFGLSVIDKARFAIMTLVDEYNNAYSIPISPSWIGNSIYIHSALEGRKIDILKSNPKVKLVFVENSVVSLQCHATADEIYDTIVKNHRNISRGTVCRNLNLLSNMGEICKMEMSCGADRFDHECHEHYHTRFLKCGRDFDVEMDIIADLGKNIKDTLGFEFNGHDIIIKGICLVCKI